jgi:hypothetical protein
MRSFQAVAPRSKSDPTRRSHAGTVGSSSLEREMRNRSISFEHLIQSPWFNVQPGIYEPATFLGQHRLGMHRSFSLSTISTLELIFQRAFPLTGPEISSLRSAKSHAIYSIKKSVMGRIFRSLFLEIITISKVICFALKNCSRVSWARKRRRFCATSRERAGLAFSSFSHSSRYWSKNALGLSCCGVVDDVLLFYIRMFVNVLTDWEPVTKLHEASG